MSDREYTCAICKGVFEPTWSEEEAEEELAATFPGVAKEDCEVVCDDCWERIKPNEPTRAETEGA